MKTKAKGVRRSKTPPASPVYVRFPIIGIGASAGGLEALEHFLEQVPPGSGMAYVIVQHLDPTRKGMIAELLQRKTRMKVGQIRTGTPVIPNRVYVIPPNKDLSIVNGVLHLSAPVTPRGLRLPIDYFLHSLGQDQQTWSVGVILSGMGADGTLGLRTIREKAGLTLVQETATAKFDSMPRHAIEEGLADVVAPPGELPARIIAHFAGLSETTRTENAPEGPKGGSLERVVLLLRAHTGNDFTHYRRNTLHRRIERRMGIHKIPKLAAYARYLEENPQELNLLFKELLIGVTHFFRDPAAWAELRGKVLPPLLARLEPGQALRAWMAGCSTGEEAYSLAILLREALGETTPDRKLVIQIFATDLDRDAIDHARQGVFPPDIASSISEGRLKRFFVKEERGYRIRQEIREMVIFAPQNLIMDPPFTKLDIVSCRNLLIYLTSEVQKKLIPLFHYALNPGGILFLGSAETIGDATDLFESLGGKSRLFWRRGSLSKPGTVDFPSSFSTTSPTASETRPAPKPPPSLQSLADQLILQHCAPPAVLTNEKGDIVYVSGRTGKYLEPAAGKANWNLFVMAREGLRYELARAFQEALRHADHVTLRGLKVEANGGTQSVEVTVQRLSESGPLQGMFLTVFIDVTMPPPAGKIARLRDGGSRLAELEKELIKVHAESRIVHDEMQTSQEELRSTNEELQSTNEELQSTNEELTTSKEEMQSMNEELQTVNTELQSKVDELSRASDDMKNLLNSTDIATLFLDRNLNVRRFTPQATKIIKLIPADVGRPITDLASDLRYPELAEDARLILQTLASAEKPISARDGRWFTVRIMPYRTTDDRIDGVVITFADITSSKTLEARLRTQNARREKRRAGDARETPRIRKDSSALPRRARSDRKV